MSAFLRGRHAPRVRRTVPADGGAAWGDRETRDQWGTYVRRLVGFAVAAVVATGLTVFAFVSEGGQDRERLTHATAVRGTVLDGGYGRKSTQDHVRVRYRLHGRAYVETLNGPGPDVLPRGRQVTVYVADDDPHSIRTRAYANHEDSVDLGRGAADGRRRTPGRLRRRGMACLVVATVATAEPLDLLGGAASRCPTRLVGAPVAPSSARPRPPSLTLTWRIWLHRTR